MDIKEFDDLIHVGHLKKSVKLGSHEFVLKTLSSGEYVAMTKQFPDNSPMTQAEKFEAIQRATLAHSIESVDGKKPTVEEKERLLSLMQLALSNMLYNEYMDLVAEQGKLLDDAKKNSSAPVTST